MIYKYVGATAFILMGLQMAGILTISAVLVGVLLIIAGIALAIGQ